MLTRLRPSFKPSSSVYDHGAHALLVNGCIRSVGTSPIGALQARYSPEKMTDTCVEHLLL